MGMWKRNDKETEMYLPNNRLKSSLKTPVNPFTHRMLVGCRAMLLVEQIHLSDVEIRREVFLVWVTLPGVVAFVGGR